MKVGNQIPKSVFESPEMMVDEYKDIMVELFDHYGMSNNLCNRCLAWLDSTDFYIAPASTKYHDASQCGLLAHTLKVVNCITELSLLSMFENINIYDAVLCAMVHDWCKIDFYESYLRNVKDDETGEWHHEIAYRCKGSSIPLGHGVTSLFLAQKFFKLTAEESLAIRWHMGEYDMSDCNKYDLFKANETYPLVIMLQIADKLASAIL